VSEMVKYLDTIDPMPLNSEIYSQLYDRVYKKMYDKLEPFYHEIREITGYPEK